MVPLLNTVKCLAGPRGFEPRTSALAFQFYSFFRVFLRGFGNNFRFFKRSLPLYPT